MEWWSVDFTLSTPSLSFSELMELLLALLLLLLLVDVGTDPLEVIVVAGPLVDEYVGTVSDGGFDNFWSRAFTEAASRPT